MRRSLEAGRSFRPAWYQLRFPVVSSQWNCPANSHCGPTANTCVCKCGFFDAGCTSSVPVMRLCIDAEYGVEYGNTVGLASWFNGNPSGEVMYSFTVPDTVDSLVSVFLRGMLAHIGRYYRVV